MITGMPESTPWLRPRSISTERNQAETSRPTSSARQHRDLELVAHLRDALEPSARHQRLAQLEVLLLDLGELRRAARSFSRRTSSSAT